MTSFPLAEFLAPTPSRSGGVQGGAVTAASLQAVSVDGIEGKLLAEGNLGPLKTLAFADLFAAASNVPARPAGPLQVLETPSVGVGTGILPEASASSTSRLALAGTLMAAKSKAVPVDVVLEAVEAPASDVLPAIGEAVPVAADGMPTDGPVLALGDPAVDLDVLAPTSSDVAEPIQSKATAVVLALPVEQTEAETAIDPLAADLPEAVAVVENPVSSVLPVGSAAPELDAAPEADVAVAAVASAAPTIVAAKPKGIAAVERAEPKQGMTNVEDVAPLDVPAAIATEVIPVAPQDVIAPVVAPVDAPELASVQPAPIEEARPATPSVSPAVTMPNGVEVAGTAAQPIIQTTAAQPNTSAAPTQMMAAQAQLAMLDGEWPAGFVQSVGAMVGANGETMTLTLTPERLGTLQIRLAVQDGVTNVHIVTDTPEAARLFNEAQGRLGELMARAGIEMGSISSGTSAASTQSASSNGNSSAFNQSLNQNLAGQSGGQGAGNGSGAGQDGQRGGQTAQQSQPASTRPDPLRSGARSQSTTSVDLMA